MDIAAQALIQLQMYLMVLARIGGVFGFAPVFGSHNIPRQAKIALSLVLALVIFPGIPLSPGDHWNSLPSYAFCIGKEIVVGVIIGYVAALITTAMQLAGQFIDMQIGFGLVNIVDPVSGTQVTVIGQLHYIIAILLFLKTNSHHLLLTAVSESYQLVPVDGSFLGEICQSGLVALFGKMFSLAFKIAAPVTCALLLTDIVLAVMARAVPQMNVFIVGFPLKIFAGLFILAVTIPAVIGILGQSFHGLGQSIALILGSVR